MRIINDYYAELNHFLVEVFNEILRVEEASLKKGEFKNLSVREMHVIEAICTANERETGNRATDIAHALRISAGTLTTTVSLLEKKGYIKRKQDVQDKRIIRLFATEKGMSANRAHQSFHHEMVTNVMNTLDIEGIEVLIKGLKSLEMFFNSNK
ncbi:MAG: MarR family transcriptional regulator [Bacillota bacterium]